MPKFIVKLFAFETIHTIIHIHTYHFNSSHYVWISRQTKVTAGHSLFDLEIEKDVECKEHKDEAIRFYCEPCDACVCILCTFHDHRDHDILQFGEAATRHRTGIVQMVESCRETVDKFDSQIDAMARCEETIHIAEQQIHDAAIEFIQVSKTCMTYIA